MKLALAQAAEALALDEVPVGAVAVLDGAVIGAGYNRKECDRDPTAHAEMIALRQAAAHVDNWRLIGVTLYCTLEPCPMCAGAMIAARVRRCVFGAYDPKAGALASLYGLGSDPRLNHELEVRGGVLAEPCGQLLSDFFASRRSL